MVSTLESLFEVRGEPEFIRSDNGPEFIAEAVRSWLARRGSKTLSIAPGSPWENAYSETFNSRLRDELLDRLRKGECPIEIAPFGGLCRAAECRSLGCIGEFVLCE